MKNFGIPQQIIPLVIIFAVAISGLIVARSFLVPETFGDYGHYRGAAPGEIAQQEIVYAGYQACLECHDDIYELKQQSRHKLVSCEVCHGPAAKHVEAPDEFTPEAPRGREGCPLCHGYDPARPTGFPQINPQNHNPGKACMSCHEPHNPLLPQTPGECSACHQDVANVKLVSHHATLECTQCHDVPKEHLVNPRFASAEKPTDISTCGFCHAEDTDSPQEIPRIDLLSHSERYLCWDCHYPHHPEANR